MSDRLTYQQVRAAATALGATVEPSVHRDDLEFWLHPGGAPPLSLAMSPTARRMVRAGEAPCPIGAVRWLRDLLASEYEKLCGAGAGGGTE